MAKALASTTCISWLLPTWCWGKTAFLAEINSRVQLTRPYDLQKGKKRKKQPLFIYMEGSQLAQLLNHETLARAAGASHAHWSWHHFPLPNLCKGPAHDARHEYISGWSAWVPEEWLEIILTGWTRFLPIPAFQWRSYFWVMLYKAPGTAEKKYHTVGRNRRMTHLTLYEVLQPEIGAKTLGSDI